MGGVGRLGEVGKLGGVGSWVELSGEIGWSWEVG